MKKSAIALVLILGLCLTFVGCTNGNEPDITIPSASDNADTNPQSSSPEETSAEETSDKSTCPTEEKSTILADPVVGSDDDYFGVRKYKYRYNYYSIPYQFIELVGEENYTNWYNSLDKSNFYEIEEMLMVTFIKHFNISKADFDEANVKNADVYKELGVNPIYPPYVYPDEYKDYSYNNEAYEIYNADIIYTFDNELINEYYARPPEVIIENGTNALGEKVD